MIFAWIVIAAIINLTTVTMATATNEIVVVIIIIATVVSRFHLINLNSYVIRTKEEKQVS